MTTCERLDELLFDGSPAAMDEASRHAATCARCAETLAAWTEIGSVARSLHTTWQNDMLWPRIDRALRNERRRSPARLLWQVAAAMVLIVGLGATMVYALRIQTREAAFDREILRLTALDEVERAERAHLEAIDRLEQLAESRLEEAQTPVMVSYKEKLMLLDDAIAECEANIERNRQNAHLRKQLLAMYSDKQQTLQDVLREDQ
jgi:hypothetical protein